MRVLEVQTRRQDANSTWTTPSGSPWTVPGFLSRPPRHRPLLPSQGSVEGGISTPLRPVTLFEIFSNKRSGVSSRPLLLTEGPFTDLGQWSNTGT